MVMIEKLLLLPNLGMILPKMIFSSYLFEYLKNL